MDLQTRDLDALDEAYDSFHATGPEFNGWLSNHGPMAAQALVRHGHADLVPNWSTQYRRRLEPRPRATHRIDDWTAALGDPRRLGDWLAWFDEELRDAPWEVVLERWWPRLVPGIAAGATHGVIRVGHVVATLRDHGATPVRLAEFADALGYWAARWQHVPTLAPPAAADLARSLPRLPRVPDQSGGIRARLAQLFDPGVPTGGSPDLEVDVDGWLRTLVTESVALYAAVGGSEPIMLVHAATAPNAVLRVLPSVPARLAVPSAVAAWSAVAALVAAYVPTAVHPRAPIGRAGGHADLAQLFADAAEHGDEHVVKLADTALDVAAWAATPSDASPRAVRTAMAGIPRLAAQ